MRRVVKIFMVVAIMFMLVFTVTNKVNAAVFDASGYNELSSDDNTENTTKNEVKEETKTEEDKNETKTETKNESKNEKKTDTATTSIIQAGSITTLTCVAIAGVTVAAIVFGYKKVKEYNF